MSAAAVAMGAPATTFQLDYMGYAVRRRAQRANMHSAGGVKRPSWNERWTSVRCEIQLAEPQSEGWRELHWLAGRLTD